MVHAGMSKEEIGNSSLPFITAIMSTMGKRFCENLGVPYKSKKELEQEEEDFDEEEYPVPAASVEKRKPKTKSKDSNKIYSASSKQDVIEFFGGMATFEDS